MKKRVISGAPHEHTEHDSVWKDGFLFLGNQPALDFLNTRPRINEDDVELIPDFAALLRWFRASGLVTPAAAGKLERQWAGSARAKKAVEDLRALRERLRREVVAREHGGAVHASLIPQLNRLMAEHPVRSRLRSDGRAMQLYWEFRQPEDLPGPIAYYAALLFTSADRARVRKCDECVLHFLDTSKKGTRRWCSMQLCGNRKKVAAYAARQRRLTQK